MVVTVRRACPSQIPDGRVVRVTSPTRWSASTISDTIWSVHSSDPSSFIGGPSKADIVIVGYEPEWPICFEQERRAIVGVLADRAIAVDRVGSTSVPGLAAKPIIDVCLTVADSAGSWSCPPRHGLGGATRLARERV